MRDFESERPKQRAVRQYGNVTRAGRVPPYNLLLEALDEVTKNMVTAHNRPLLQELAWRLGMKGETHACEVIMKHAKEPVRYVSYMYGYPPVG